MKTEELSAKALKLMQSLSLTKIYLTSDGQGFTDKNRAYDRARYLTDKKVYPFENPTQAETPKENVDTDEDSREELALEFENLFGKKPAHNIGLKKLKKIVEEKKAELEKEPTETIEELAVVYEELFGEKPTNDIDIEELKTQIEEKKAELKNQETKKQED